LKDIGCFKWVPLRLYSKVPSENIAVAAMGNKWRLR
ncbi:hypothetical protein T08_834, partial [Trichinella sp. T8]